MRCGLVLCLRGIAGRAGAGGPRAGLACRLRWRLSASWAWQVGSLAGLGKWLVDGLAACHAAALPMGRHSGWAGAGLGKLRSWLLAGASWAGQVGWSAQLDSPPTPPQRSHPFLGADWPKQASEECKNEGSDLFRNCWIYEAMFRCSVLARSDAVRSKDCFL